MAKYGEGVVSFYATTCRVSRRASSCSAARSSAPRAGGAAAAIAVAKGIEPRAVAYSELREALIAGGAILPQ